MLPSIGFRVFLGIAVLAGMAAIAMVAAGTLRAQDPDLKATYGEAELKAGFNPDPHIVKVFAGGPIETDKGGFKHFVAKQPDFRLIYQAGKYSLFLHADSTADTTLLVKTPDGTWIVDDDSGGNNNPMIKFASPKSGRYDIWVGTIEKGSTPAATLSISEIK
jgi:hypothetical protein